MDTTIWLDKEMNKQLDSMELTYIKVTKYVDEKVLGVCRQVNKLASIVVPDTVVVIDDNRANEFELNRTINGVLSTLVNCLEYFNPDTDIDIESIIEKITEHTEKNKKSQGVNKFFTYVREANESLSVIHEITNAFCNTLGLDTVFESDVKNSENAVKPIDNSWRDSIIYELGMINIQTTAISQCLNNIQVDIDDFQSALSKVIDQCTGGGKLHQGVDLSPLDRPRY